MGNKVVKPIDISPILDKDSEYGEEINLDEYILGKPIYTSNVFEGIKYEKYVTQLSKIKNEINKWEFNRDISQDHIEKIKSEITVMEYPHLMGSIKLAKDIRTEEVKLLDGQHRYESLWRLREKNADFDMPIEIDIYYVDDIHDNMALNTLFKRANNNKNIQDIDIPGDKLMRLMQMLVDKWPKNIKDTDKNANRPNITARELSKKLNLVISDSQLNSEEIFDEIVKINEWYHNASIKDIFGRDRATASANKIKAYELKAKRDEFYLNMDCKLNVDWWINNLSI